MRSVINIIGNGPDNVNEDAQTAGDMALGLGFTVNGIVLGHDPDLVAYFQQTSAGCPGSFVANVSAAETMADVLQAKVPEGNHNRNCGLPWTVEPCRPAQAGHKPRRIREAD
jgi:Protein of unknown function (DUF1194)